MAAKEHAKEHADDPEDADGDAGPQTDGTASVVCPYCFEPNEILLDPSGGKVQDYIEDCQVCCQPWHVHVRWRRNGSAHVHVATGDG
jgi:Cysteine-rich CPXCG